jgi:hypothetical protein
MARIAAQLHEQGHLRPGSPTEEANDVLWVITSFESFDLLYSGRGLPLDTVIERLTDAAERALMTARRRCDRAGSMSLFSITNWSR